MTKRWTKSDLEKLNRVKQAGQMSSQDLKELLASTANALTQQALTTFRSLGFKAWRQNNAAVYDPKKGVFRKNSAHAGISDVMGYYKADGRILACEVKVGKDQLSLEQADFLNEVSNGRGIPLVIRTAEDLRQFARQFQQDPRGWRNTVVFEGKVRQKAAPAKSLKNGL